MNRSGGSARGLAVGMELDGWRLEEVLGRGGMGVVYRATHTGSGLVCALKVLVPAGLDCWEALQRFRREVKILARLEHPSVVRILQEALEHEPPYFCMELLPGGSLADRITSAAATSHGRVWNGAIPADRLTALALELAEGLAAIHARQVLHRDLKPSNVLFTAEDQAKLVDFGVSKALDLSSFTMTGEVMGTLYYMAPETFGKRGFDERSDLYQLGITLFEAATGSKPYSQDQLAPLLVGKPLPPLRRLQMAAPLVPGWFQPVLDRLTAFDPANRFQSAEELAKLLRRRLSPAEERSAVVRSEAPRGKPAEETAPMYGGSTPARRPSTMLFATLAAVAVLGVAGVIWNCSGKPAREAVLMDPGVGPTAGLVAPTATAPNRPALVLAGITRGSSAARLWLDRPAPAGLTVASWRSGTSMRTTRAVLADSRVIELTGLDPGATYRGELAAGEKRTQFGLTTLRRIPGVPTVYLRPEPSVIDNLWLESAGSVLLAAWRARDAADGTTASVECCESPDQARTWSAIERLQPPTPGLCSAAVASVSSGHQAGWLVSCPPGPSSIGLRFRSASTGRWDEPLVLSLPVSAGHLELVACGGNSVGLLGSAVDPSGSHLTLWWSTFEAGSRRVPAPRKVLRAQGVDGGRILALASAGRLYVLLASQRGYPTAPKEGPKAEDLTAGIRIPRTDLPPATIYWTSTALPDATEWRPLRPLTETREDARWFDALAGAGAVTVAYESAASIQLRRTNEDGSGFSPPVRLGTSLYRELSPSLLSESNRLFMMYLQFTFFRGAYTLVLQEAAANGAWTPLLRQDLPVYPARELRGLLLGGTLLAVFSDRDGHLLANQVPVSRR